MEIPVLIEPVANNGFRATCRIPVDLTAEGATRDEAMARLRDQIQARMTGGATIAALELPGQPHPLVRYAGMFENNPLFDEWQAEMAEYRRKIDEDPDSP